MPLSKIMASKKRQLNNLQKINKNHNKKFTNKMRNYKTRLKIHKRKVKIINNKTIAKNNLDLMKSKRVHLSKINNKINKSKTLTITCQSFKNRPKSMID